MVNACFLGRRGLLAAVSVLSTIAILCLLSLGPVHHHQDFKSHNDCSACQWETSGFSLIQEEIILFCVAAVAFLAGRRRPVRLATEVIGQHSIRAPPFITH